MNQCLVSVSPSAKKLTSVGGKNAALIRVNVIAPRSAFHQSLPAGTVRRRVVATMHREEFTMAKIETKLPVKTEKREPAAREDMWSPLESLRREIDKLFETFRPAAWSVPFSRSLLGFEMPSLTGKEWQIAPAVDLVEKDTEYEISAELPGLEEKNIEVKLSNGTLTIKGEKKEEKEEREKDYYLSERRFGSFQRRFQLPHGVDPDKIEATFTKGVLKLKLPKTPEAQKSEKKIAVRAV